MYAMLSLMLEAFKTPRIVAFGGMAPVGLLVCVDGRAIRKYEIRPRPCFQNEKKMRNTAFRPVHDLQYVRNRPKRHCGRPRGENKLRASAK